MKSTGWVVCALVACLVTSPAVASPGDRLLAFQHCVDTCIDINCGPGHELPLHLRALLWDCPQNCDYTCQRIITKERIKQGEQILQFHGKWPFLRIYGVQELASVVFSVLNFLPHYLGLRMLISENVLHRHHHRQKDETRPVLIRWYIWFAIINMNAWLWSSVFHTRDFILTERLDYFSAGLTILYGFYTALVRVFRLDLPSRRIAFWLVSAVCAFVYIGHVGYLSLIRFSYSYNMLFGVTVGILQNILWSYHAFQSYLSYPEHRRSQKRWALWPFFIVISISAGMGFELFDFPPIGDLVDAHALWHLATVGPTFLWYRWMQRDLAHIHRREKQD